MTAPGTPAHPARDEPPGYGRVALPRGDGERDGRDTATGSVAGPTRDAPAGRAPGEIRKTLSGAGERDRNHASEATVHDHTGRDLTWEDRAGRDRTGESCGGRDLAGQERTGLAYDEPRDGGPGRPDVLPALASALARELVRRVEEDRRAMAEAHRSPTPAARHRITQCRRKNAEALKAIVRRHAWPTADLVGAAASTAALMILLHTPDLDFQLRCRDLIAQATADGRCPAPHHAYIADHCAVELGQPQFYGTRVDPATLHPYPVRHPGTLDERRRDVGLAPLDVQMRTLRLSG